VLVFRDHIFTLRKDYYQNSDENKSIIKSVNRKRGKNIRSQPRESSYAELSQAQSFISRKSFFFYFAWFVKL